MHQKTQGWLLIQVPRQALSGQTKICPSLDKIVQLPDGSSIQATHTTMLPFESLSFEARKADVLPGLQPNSLVSIVKFADADYTTIFHPRGEDVTVYKKNSFQLKLLHTPVLQGWRDTNGLWRLSREEQKLMRVKQEKLQLTTCTTGHAPQKFGRVSNSDFQKSLHCDIGGCR